MKLNNSLLTLPAAATLAMSNGCIPEGQTNHPTYSVIGDGVHCTDDLHLLDVQPKIRKEIQISADYLSERFTLDFRYQLANEICPNAVDYIVEQDKVFVIEQVGEMRKKVDVMVYFLLESTRKALPVEQNNAPSEKTL